MTTLSVSITNPALTTRYLTVPSIQTDIDNLKTDVAELQTETATNTNDISTLSSTVSNQETTLTNLDTQLTTLSTKTETNTNNISSLSSQIQTNTNDISTLNSFKNGINTTIDNRVKTDLTTTYTNNDYESMTGLKNWVLNQIPAVPTIVKCPVDLYISNDGLDTTTFNTSVPFRITETYYQSGATCEKSGYYIAFHFKMSNNFNRVESITILAMISGTTFPSFSWDTDCMFYKCSYESLNIKYNGAIYFIMNDGSTCYTPEIGRSAVLTGTPKYVHFISDVISFDALKNNVCSNISHTIAHSSFATYNTTRTPYYKFVGNEGSFNGTDTLYSVS